MRISIGLLVLCGALFGCSSDEGGAGAKAAPVCAPGKQEACACLGGGQGIQICNASGTGFDTCQCPDGGIPPGDSGADSAGSGGGGTGGTGGTSGAAGAAGSGGSAGAVSVCPSTKPNDGDSCSDPTSICPYADQQCECVSGQWDCSCPASPPTPDSACTAGASYTTEARCHYPATQCICACGDWDCYSCPAQAPIHGSACPGHGLSCAFGSKQCTCINSASTTTWQCDDAGCPVTKPADYSPCTIVGTKCAYEFANECQCQQFPVNELDWSCAPPGGPPDPTC